MYFGNSWIGCSCLHLQFTVFYNKCPAPFLLTFPLFSFSSTHTLHLCHTLSDSVSLPPSFSSPAHSRAIRLTSTSLSVHADCDFYLQNSQVKLLHLFTWHWPADPKSFFFTPVLISNHPPPLSHPLLLLILFCVTLHLRSSVLSLGSSGFTNTSDGHNTNTK